VETTLVKIRSPEVRLEAVREVARRLIAKGEAKSATGIAGRVGSPDEVAELTAVIGLELLAAGLAQESGDAAALALQRHLAPPPVEATEPDEAATKPKEASGKRGPAPASLIALWVALNRRDAEAKFPPDAPTGAGAEHELAAGYAEGLGYKGERDRARAAVRTTDPAGRIEALVGLAAASLSQNQVEGARGDLEEALNILEKEQRVSAFVLLRLVQLRVRAGMSDRLKPAAAAISDKDVRGRAQLEIVRGRLAATSEVGDEAVLQDLDKNSPSYALALEALARHNARVDGPRAARAQVDGWQPEKNRPFGYVGVALGARDARR
jgi:hypothetical protein